MRQDLLSRSFITDDWRVNHAGDNTNVKVFSAGHLCILLLLLCHCPAEILSAGSWDQKILCLVCQRNRNTWTSSSCVCDYNDAQCSSLLSRAEENVISAAHACQTNNYYFWVAVQLLACSIVSENSSPPFLTLSEWNYCSKGCFPLKSTPPFPPHRWN